MDIRQPKPPHEEILAFCQQTVGQSIWAIALTVDEYGRHVWEAYCDDKKVIGKVPKTFRGHTIQTIFCERPKI